MATDLQYTKTLSPESSFQLVRTNPKLTGNIKLTLNEAGDMWLDSIKANLELAKDDYSRFPIDITQSLAANVYQFFKNGETPNEIIFGLTEGVDATKTSKDYKDQYDFSNYFSGVKYFPSNKYDERLSYFAPLYLKKEIPKYFVILKIKDPLNDPINISKSNFENGQSRADYLIGLFKDASIIKTFDLSENSKPGKFIRDYLNNKNFPISPLTVSFEEDEFTTWNGIVVNSGTLGNRGELLYSQYKSSTPLKFFEENITKGFERNGVIFPNILNLEFIFDDNTSENYDFNRYLGLYVNSIELSELDIDLERMYNERAIWLNTPRLRRPYLESEETTLTQTNTDGVVVPYKNLNFNMTEFEDIFSDSETLYFNYLTDKDNRLYLPKLEQPYSVDLSADLSVDLVGGGTTVTVTSVTPHGYTTDDLIIITSSVTGLTGSYFITKISDTQFTYLNSTVTASVTGSAAKDIGVGKMVLSNTNVDVANFFGPSNNLFLQDKGFGSNSAGFSYGIIKVKTNLSNLDEIKFYHPNGTNVDTVGKYDYFTAATGYSLTLNPGEYYAYNDYENIVGHDVFYFNPVGLANEVATAIAGCFNSLRNRTVTAYAYDEYVFIKCAAAGDFDSLHKLKFTSPSAQYSSVEIDETGGTQLVGTYFQFKGGSKATNNRLVIDRDHLAKIDQELDNLLVKTNGSWSKIKKTSGYVDLITEENLTSIKAKNSAIDNFLNKMVVTLENEESPNIQYGDFIMRKKFRPEFGLISLFPIKDIDFDFYTSGYLNFPLIDLYQYYYIPSDYPLLEPGTQYICINSGTGIINDPTMQATSATAINLSAILSLSTVTVNVGTATTYGFANAFQTIQVQHDAENYFYGTVNTYNPLTGDLVLDVVNSLTQVKYTSITALSSWTIFQIAAPTLTSGGPFFPFKVNQMCSYSNLVGFPVVSYYSGTLVYDPLTYPILDENTELKNFPGFSILKDPAKVIAADLSDEYTIKTKYTNGLTNTEYDFYKENEATDFALRSKIIPYITKWGIKNGLDSRDNPYRLNTEIVFGRNNFSPDHTDRSQNPDNFTHEWFYIESKFNYVDALESIKQNTYYFDTPLDLTQLLSDPEYFINYFTYSPQFGTDTNGEPIDVASAQFRYSNIFKNAAGQYETFFKGFKVLFKDVHDSAVLGEDGKPVAKKETSRFDNYKFSCILKPVKEDFFNRTQPPISFKFIEHKDYKFIVLVIEIAIGSIDDIGAWWLGDFSSGSYIPRQRLVSGDPAVVSTSTNVHWATSTFSNFETIYGDYRIKFDQVDGVDISNINHNLLYSLKNKKYNIRLDNFSNIKLSSQLGLAVGGIEFLTSTNGTIKKSEIAQITNYPDSLSDEFTPTSNLGLFAMKNTSSGVFYIIDQTQVLVPTNSNPIDAALDDKLIFNLDITTPSSDLSLVTLVAGPPYTTIYQTLPLSTGFAATIRNYYSFFVIGGGKNYFEKLFQKLSFSKFKSYVNSLDPIIEFESYSLDSNGVSQLATNPRYYIEVPDISHVQLTSQIIVNSDIDTPTQFSFDKEIGYQYEQAALNNVIEFNRYKGEYEPLVKDVLYCKSNFKFFKNKINDLKLSNVRLNSQISELLTLSNFNHIKVSDTKILDLESDSKYTPIYPKIGEVAIGQADYFLLNSNWDWGFHHKYSSKTVYSPVSGALRVEEDENFLGKILIVPNTINLEQFTLTTLTPNQKLEDVDLTQIEMVVKENELQVDGYLNLNNAITTYLLNDGIEQKFNQYLVDSSAYIGNYGSIQEYVKDYIKINILKLYDITTADFFSKRDAKLFSTSKVKNSNTVSFDFLTDAQRVKLGYSEFKNVQINKSERLILKFSIPKSNDAGLSISPTIKIKFI
jgi:hypothetical protein